MSRLCRLSDNYALSCHGNTVHYRSSLTWEWAGLYQIKRAHSELELLLYVTCEFSSRTMRDKCLEETLGLKPKPSSCRFLGKLNQHNPEEAGPPICSLRSVGSAKGWAELAVTCHPGSPSRGPFHSSLECWQLTAPSWVAF